MFPPYCPLPVGPVNAAAVRKKGTLNQPSTVHPVAEPASGKVASLQARYQACAPVLPRTPVCAQAALPGDAVTGPPSAADDAPDDWGSPYIHPASCATM